MEFNPSLDGLKEALLSHVHVTLAIYTRARYGQRNWFLEVIPIYYGHDGYLYGMGTDVPLCGKGTKVLNKLLRNLRKRAKKSVKPPMWRITGLPVEIPAERGAE